jgi:Fe-S cluster assembly iron-binding protein IscA
VIRRSLELAGADPSAVGVRLRMAGGAVRPRFVPAPEPGDEVVEAEGLRIFVAAALVEEIGDIEIDVTDEHEQITVRRLDSSA